MAKEKFEVIREHIGDKPYAVGDTREAEHSDVAHLIGTSLRKKAPEAKNKAEPKHPNKSEKVSSDK